MFISATNHMFVDKPISRMKPTKFGDIRSPLIGYMHCLVRFNAVRERLGSAWQRGKHSKKELPEWTKNGMVITQSLPTSGCPSLTHSQWFVRWLKSKQIAGCMTRWCPKKSFYRLAQTDFNEGFVYDTFPIKFARITTTGKLVSSIALSGD